MVTITPSTFKDWTRAMSGNGDGGTTERLFLLSVKTISADLDRFSTKLLRLTPYPDLSRCTRQTDVRQPETNYSPTCVIISNFVLLLRPLGVIMETPHENFDPLRSAFQEHSRPLVVWSGTDTGRSATHDCEFLLVFHSNCEPISYRFRHKGQCLRKKFPPPYI